MMGEATPGQSQVIIEFGHGKGHRGRPGPARITWIIDEKEIGTYSLRDLEDDLNATYNL